MVTLPVPQPLPVGSIAVVAAHPDDEVIGVGGQLLRWEGASVIVVSVTGGAPPDDHDARTAGFPDGRSYAAARRTELRSALSWLPHPPRLIPLDRTDQQVARELDAVVAQLGALLDREQPDAVITHPYEGGHPDHDALAVAVGTLARSGAARFVHLEFAGYFEDEDGRLATGRFCAEPPCEAVRVPLTVAERRLKRLMLRSFRSQQRTLEPFVEVAHEWMRVAPTYDFTAPPNGGRVWYDHLSLGMRSDEWLALVARHLRRHLHPDRDTTC